jgi:hypothetical protein
VVKIGGCGRRFFDVQGVGRGSRMGANGGDTVAAAGKYKKWLTPEGLEKVKGWATAGLTDEQIAKNIGTTRKTLFEWRRKWPELQDAISEGKRYSDEEVENSLYKKCLGYTVKLQKTFKVRRVDYDKATGKKLCEREELVTGEDEEYVQPDTQAMKFWLSNRLPEKWRNNVSFDGTVGGGIEEYLKKMESAGGDR